MEKDDHYGKYSEYNERYQVVTEIKGKSNRRGMKTAIGTIVAVIAFASILVTAGFLYRNIKRKKMQEEQAAAK